MSTIKSSAENLTLNADGANNDIKFQSNGVEKASIDQDGNVIAAGTISSTGDTTITSGDIVFATAGKGICLGVTTNTDANTLDDYEEGVHTVTFTPSTSGTITMNSSQDTISYTKIGRLVTCTGEINVSSVSSPVGSTSMSLPFACAGNSTDRDKHWGFAPTTYHIPHVQDNPPMGYSGAATAAVNLIYTADDGSFTNYVAVAGESFFVSFSYVAA